MKSSDPAATCARIASAAPEGATSSVILLADRNTVTLSLLALEYMTTSVGAAREVAGIISLFIVAMTAGVALTARWFGYQVGLRDR